MNTFRILYNFLLSVFAPLIIQMFYKDIWGLKKSFFNRPTNFKKNIYYKFLDRENAWIGINSQIKNPPVFPHGLKGVFISDKAVIDEDVVIFHQVTIGSNTLADSKNYGSPYIEKGVYIGCGAKIIGKVRIGKNSRIGANAVIVKDVAENSVVVLNGPRVIVKKEPLHNGFTSIEHVSFE